MKSTEVSRDGKSKTFIQFIKFGIVGASNTIISYCVEMLCYYVIFSDVKFVYIVSFLNENKIPSTGEAVKVVITSAIAFIISVTNSYILNNRFVFKSGSKSMAGHIVSYLKTLLCYGITGLVLSPIIKILLKNSGIAYYIATISSLIITVPLNYILNKFWAFAKKGE
ncbi:MAG: GtrA family protein [Clostridia bacterium]|nr:GtrA family protein [Clostridia bacterium]